MTIMCWKQYIDNKLFLLVVSESQDPQGEDGEPGNDQNQSDECSDCGVDLLHTGFAESSKEASPDRVDAEFQALLSSESGTFLNNKQFKFLDLIQSDVV